MPFRLIKVSTGKPIGKMYKSYTKANEARDTIYSIGKAPRIAIINTKTNKFKTLRPKKRRKVRIGRSIFDY